MQARLSRFQGANAISSADFYDNGEGGGSGPARANSDFDVTAGDLVNRLSMQVQSATRLLCVPLLVPFHCTYIEGVTVYASRSAFSSV